MTERQDVAPAEVFGSLADKLAGALQAAGEVMASRRRIGFWLWAAVAVSLVVSLTPWAPFLLYPFKLFTTWVHECGHALMTVLVGGRVTSITIEPDTSGLTQSLVPVGRVARGLVASSGYLGAAVVGCLLMAATRVEKWAHVILLGLGACMLFTLFFWLGGLPSPKGGNSDFSYLSIRSNGV